MTKTSAYIIKLYGYVTKLALRMNNAEHSTEHTNMQFKKYFYLSLKNQTQDLNSQTKIRVREFQKLSSRQNKNVTRNYLFLNISKFGSSKTKGY